MSYKECREDFFVNLIKHAENKIKYWKRQKCYRCEIDNNLAEAGAEISYCQDALKAFEKQTPKKPEHADGAWSICPACCGSVPNDTEEAVNHKTSYCDHCGQALDWSDTE